MSRPGTSVAVPGPAVGEQQDRDEVLHREDAGQDHDDPKLRHQQRDVDREDAPDRVQAVQLARVQHVLGQVLQAAEEGAAHLHLPAGVAS